MTGELRADHAAAGVSSSALTGDPMGSTLTADPPTLDRAGLGTVHRGVPEVTVARLPVYLRVLTWLAEHGVETVSSGALAEAAGVTSAQLRKDLSHLGSFGTRGVGYDVAQLRAAIGRAMGSTQQWRVVIVGLGNLGTALANYTGFTARGFQVVALLDASTDLVGHRVHDLAIQDVAELEAVVAATGAVIAVIATPAEVAQSVADRLVRAGVTSILNFAATVLVVPDHVNVRKVDLSLELQILAYHEQRKAEEMAAKVIRA